MMRTRLSHRIAFVGLAGLVIAVPSRLGRADAPTGRYDVELGTVVDTKTVLNWQQTVASSKYAWSDAGTYCSTLTLGGGGWRLPSENELQTIVDESRMSPAIDPTAFPETPGDFFWTSTTVPSFANFAWAITFNDGVTTLLDITEPEWVRCVR
jgi:Protein of unknown function (DUF1566)